MFETVYVLDDNNQPIEVVPYYHNLWRIPDGDIPVLRRQCAYNPRNYFLAYYRDLIEDAYEHFNLQWIPIQRRPEHIQPIMNFNMEDLMVDE